MRGILRQLQPYPSHRPPGTQWTSPGRARPGVSGWWRSEPVFPTPAPVRTIPHQFARIPRTRARLARAPAWSPILAFLLALVLLAAGIYSLFLGLNRPQAVPALAPAGEPSPGITGGAETDGGDRALWLQGLRRFLPGRTGRAGSETELFTAALATALPGLPRSAAAEFELPADSRDQAPWWRRWVKAVAGVDPGRPLAVLGRAVPGFGSFAGGQASDSTDHSVALSEQPPALIGTMDGAGGEWPSLLTGGLPSDGLPSPEAVNRTPSPNPEGPLPADTAESTVVDSPAPGKNRGGGETLVEGAGPESNRPLVLIYHTHTAESYQAPGRKTIADYYDWNNPNSGVIEVGREVVRALEAAGIPAIHATEANDFPVFSNSYQNSRHLVQEYRRRYPSLQVALDIHRDGMRYSPTVVQVNGQPSARIALVVGSNRYLPNSRWRTNLEFARQLDEALTALEPGLSRGIIPKEARFNQDLLPQMLLAEVGTYTNRLEEAKTAGRLLGRALAQLLANQKQDSGDAG